MENKVIFAASALAALALIMVSFCAPLAEAKGIPKAICPSECEIRSGISTELSVNLKNIGNTEATFSVVMNCEDVVYPTSSVYNLALKAGEERDLLFTMDADVGKKKTEICAFKAMTSSADEVSECDFSCKALPNFCTDGEMKCGDGGASAMECVEGAFVETACGENEACEDGVCEEIVDRKAGSFTGLLIAAIVVAAILIAIPVAARIRKKGLKAVFPRKKK